MTGGRTFHSYRPEEGHRLAHDPLSSMVGPRPIGWISSVSSSGVDNLAPYSFFNLLSYRPALIGFASVGWKDTIQNVETTREFVWNLATRDLAERMNASSADLPGAVDEFVVAGLTKLPSMLVRAPRVAEAHVSLECRLADIHRLHGADGRPADGWLAIGEVVVVHIATELIVDDRYDTARGRPILRGGGAAEYFEIDDRSRFAMRRPPA